jgi:hypothetical protein
MDTLVVRIWESTPLVTCTAMIVLLGGGYAEYIQHAGVPVVEWLDDIGVPAGMLHRSLPSGSHSPSSRPQALGRALLTEPSPWRPSGRRPHWHRTRHDY